MATLFDEEVLDAALALDTEFADLWTLTPMAAAADPNAPTLADGTRTAGVTFPGVYFDPPAKPIEPNSYDVRQVRRPGVESATPRVEISPQAQDDFFAAHSVVLVINPGDVLGRSDGANFRALAVSVSAAGYAIIRLNRI